jgi:hypothetical protein
VDPGSMTGVFTFLLTDIEGSSQLWEERPQPMALALAQHDVIARDAVVTRQGQIVQTTGDGIYAVFPEAPMAVAATLAIQIAMFSRLSVFVGGWTLATSLGHSRSPCACAGHYTGSGHIEVTPKKGGTGVPPHLRARRPSGLRRARHSML